MTPLNCCKDFALTRSVSHCGLAIYILKVSQRQKKKNYGNSIISPCKNILILQNKNPLKETKILRNIVTL
jgi:hypothetical protein